jgi:UDP-glucose 4-epimerase
MPSLSDKRIAIVGGAGFLGSHLCEKLLPYNPERLIIIDDFSSGGEEGNINHLRKNIEIYKVDATKYKLMSHIFEKENIDIAFNLAVLGLPLSLIKPKEVIIINTLITATICELLRKEKYKTLIHTSSSEAYGTAIYTHKPMDENHPTFPTTPYAASKLACDHIVLSYSKTFGLDVAIVRPFNMYGPRAHEKGYASVVTITINRILSGNPPIIHGDGLQTRDYVYVEDVAGIIPRFYEVEATRGKVINIASGKEITIQDLVHLIMKLMNYSGKIIHTKPRIGDVRRHLGDISLARSLLGYSPKTSYNEGLKKTIEWHKKLKGI